MTKEDKKCHETWGLTTAKKCGNINNKESLKK